MTSKPRAGNVELIKANANNCEDIMSHLCRLHAQRWHERNKAGMLSSEALQAFHREVAQRFAARHILALCGIFLNGDGLAVQYNFMTKNRAYTYLAGFDM